MTVVIQRAASLAIGSIAAITPAFGQETGQETGQPSDPSAEPQAGPPAAPCRLEAGDARPDCFALLPQDVFALALRMAESGKREPAIDLLEALAHNRAPEIRAEARFRKAMLLESGGDRAGAARAYRAVLDEQPDAPRVRLELARVLAQMGETEAARDQLRRASTLGLPEEVAQVVDRLQLALRSQARRGATIQIALAPDSNAVSAHRASTVDVNGSRLTLEDEARSHASLGVSAAAEAFWRPSIGARANLLLNLSGSADIYTYSRANDIAVGVALGPEILRGPTRYRPAVRFDQRWFGQKPYATGAGASLNVLHQIGSTSQVQFDFTALRRDFSANPGLDGTAWQAMVRYDRAFSPRFVARVGVRAGRQHAREDAYGNRSWGLDMIASRDLGRQTVYARASFTAIRGDAPYTLPPARRDDRIVDLEAGVSLRRFSVHGLVPSIRVHHVDSSSPVFFHAFRRTRIEFGITREL